MSKKLKSTLALIAFQACSVFAEGMMPQVTQAQSSAIDQVHSLANRAESFMQKMMISPEAIENFLLQFVEANQNTPLPYHDKNHNFILLPNLAYKSGDQVVIEALKTADPGKETAVRFELDKKFSGPLCDTIKDMPYTDILPFYVSPNKDTAKTFMWAFYKAAEGRTLLYKQNGEPYTLKFLKPYFRFGVLVAPYVENGVPNALELSDTHFAALAELASSIKKLGQRSPQEKSDQNLEHATPDSEKSNAVTFKKTRPWKFQYHLSAKQKIQETASVTPRPKRSFWTRIKDRYLINPRGSQPVVRQKPQDNWGRECSLKYEAELGQFLEKNPNYYDPEDRQNLNNPRCVRIAYWQYYDDGGRAERIAWRKDCIAKWKQYQQCQAENGYGSGGEKGVHEATLDFVIQNPLENAVKAKGPVKSKGGKKHR